MLNVWFGGVPPEPVYAPVEVLIGIASNCTLPLPLVNASSSHGPLITMAAGMSVAIGLPLFPSVSAPPDPML